MPPKGVGGKDQECLTVKDFTQEVRGLDIQMDHKGTIHKVILRLKGTLVDLGTAVVWDQKPQSGIYFFVGRGKLFETRSSFPKQRTNQTICCIFGCHKNQQTSPFLLPRHKNWGFSRKGCPTSPRGGPAGEASAAWWWPWVRARATANGDHFLVFGEAVETTERTSSWVSIYIWYLYIKIT